MSFTRTSILTLRSFASMQHHYRTTKPVRTTGAIPLTSNRRGHTTLSLHETHHPEYGEGYAVRLYATDIVTWYQNALHVDTSYASQLTNQTADYFAPFSLSLQSNKPIITTDAGSFICPPEGLWFAVSAEGPRQYDLMQGQRVRLERRVLNKTSVATVSRMLKPFKEYVTTLAGLGPVTPDTAVAMVHGVPGGLTRFQLDAFHEDNFPYLAACAYFNVYNDVRGGYMAHLNVQHAMKQARLRLYDLTGSYEWVAVPYGTLPSDLRHTRFVETTDLS